MPHDKLWLDNFVGWTKISVALDVPKYFSFNESNMLGYLNILKYKYEKNTR